MWQYGATLDLNCVRHLLAAGAAPTALTYDWLVDGGNCAFCTPPNADVLYVVFAHQHLHNIASMRRQHRLVRRLVDDWPCDKPLQLLLTRMLKHEAIVPVLCTLALNDF